MKRPIAALLAAPDRTTPRGIRDQAILETLYSTGMRAGELLALKVYDVDLVEGVARIVQGKGNKYRTVPLGRLACEAVRVYLQEVRPKLLGQQRNGRLFLSMTGRRLWHSALRSLMIEHCEKAALDREYAPHALRHACATHMLRSGASIRHIQELLGHKKLSTTQIYTHVNVDDLKAVHHRTHPREQARDGGQGRGKPGSTSTDPAR